MCEVDTFMPTPNPSVPLNTTSPPSIFEKPHSHSDDSISLPSRLRTRTPSHAPLIPSPLPQPLLRTELQLLIQLIARLLPMDEVAEAAPHAAFPAVEPAARFSEVRHGGEFAVYGAGGVPAGVEGVAGGLGGVLVFEAGVDVADEIFLAGGVSLFRDKL